MAIPKQEDLFNPALAALHDLGGSASVEEMEDKVADLLKLSDADMNEVHRGNTTKLSYRLAWARNYLKRYGLFENSSRGIWSLTAKGNKTKVVNKDDVIRTLDEKRTGKKENTGINIHQEMDFKSGEMADTLSLQEEVLKIIKAMPPADFERLCQRILRESGFIQVEVTGRSGDGGIDGRGILKVGSLIGFRVIFQCKRYKASVTSQEIREFKGTMVGRADKGLLITTGTFTRDAKFEANRDGAPPIDLIDGEQLATIMKDLNLGISREEKITVDKSWFENF